MFDDNNTFISLNVLANRVGLPRDYLKNLADKGAIPSLEVQGRRRFNGPAVDAALAKLAGGKPKGGRRDS